MSLGLGGLAYLEVLPNQRGPTCAAFSAAGRRVVGTAEGHVQRILTGNARGYRARFEPLAAG
jgi:hypothetical protein